MFMRTLCALVLLVLSSLAAFADAFDDYRAIQVDLYSAHVTPDTARRAKRLFPGQTEFLALIRKAARTDKKYLVNTREAAQRAYVAFIHLPASADVLHDFIEDQMDYFASRPMEKYPGNHMAWLWAYLENAAVIAFEATGEQRFVEQALRCSRYVYARTDKALGIEKDGMGRDDLRGWSFWHPGKGVGREPTTAGRLIAPMLRLAIAAKNSELPEPVQKEIAADAKKGIEILRTYLRYQVVEGRKRYFKYVFTGDQDAFNHMAAFSLAAAYAYKLTGAPDLRDFAVGFRAYFLAHVRKGDNWAYSWDYQITDNPDERHSTLLWKAAITTSAFVGMQDAGIHLNREDQVGLALAFLRNLMGDNYTVYSRVSAGSDNFPLTGYNLYLSDQTNIQNFTLYMLLDRWVPKVRKTVLDAVSFRPDLFSEGLLAFPSSAVAYAHMLKYPDIPQ